ncbi:metalloreductase [Coprinopsis cinerea okayama7|uniref:Metalloreductase n=1 Tax=Coprinopsis cinerea (strain Okayama-7 / 130 / ATCC MYA-4618 / FGSC 9003) TaxID=240176 RepID=A8PEW2_COPC7|nr:metalloreductase [Coprinopsis cinerea okayama7\|eukprot:XP_001840858.1 metalloreductase [Coprinopsis cinerea okayama7\
MAVLSTPLLGAFSAFLLLFLTVTQLATPAVADGVGMIGAGKWLYKPLCAHACRRIIVNNRLTCDSKIPGDTWTPPPSSHHGGHHHRRHLHHLINPKECYLRDAAFLRTLALCMEDRCARDDVLLSSIQEYWEGHLTTLGTGDWTIDGPVMSYEEALRLAHEDVEEIGEENVPFTRAGQPLNVTSFIPEDVYIAMYNGLGWHERSQRDHGWNGIAVAVSSVCIPIVFSLFRFLPARPLWYSRLVNVLEMPLMGNRHRTPIVANLGIMPTRGQTLYLVYLLATQIFLGIFPLTFIYPNFNVDDDTEAVLKIIGDRTGVLAMADFVALFLFSSRNNVLLWITNWSHSTFLLLHRWIAYCCIFHTSIHSLFMLILVWDSYDKQIKRAYWIWGVIGTFAFVFIWPLSILPVRRKAYEFFLVTHQFLAIFGLLGTFIHIYRLYKYDWGYEIWVYIGALLWLVDRFVRIVRMVSNGYRKAVVTAVDPSAEYIQVDIDGIVAEGHVYLYFPTLSWRIWENHPYSVLSSFKGGPTTRKTVTQGNGEKSSQPSSTMSSSDESVAGNAGPRVTLLVRPMDGFSKTLVNRLLASNGRLTLPVFVESSYHANPSAHGELAHCSTLLCIAGGVGITAVLPIIKTFGGVRARLAWGVRNEWLIRAVEPELNTLNSLTVEVETSVGSRLPIVDILKEELQKDDVEGDLGVVACGPTGMADEIRVAIGQLGPKAKRGVVFVDDAFSW